MMNSILMKCKESIKGNSFGREDHIVQCVKEQQSNSCL
ncbi:hypothetical protein Gogos_015370 [Gossypium gossypioides]|uniref:Uncharacterized protein n=1 Tax=Gossypium gossypioides TaxID=34282 RepID=A0A7J9C1E2_GOSGO|nr:hypothetical protein [Gossypium gossypioides]